jgi:prepilin-type processing-associated H-X9-DG protein
LDKGFDKDYFSSVPVVKHSRKFMNSQAESCRNLRRHAFTVPELVLVIGCLVLLAALLLPALPRSHTRSSHLSCVNNLKQIGLCFKQEAIDMGYGGRFPMQVSVTNGGTIELVPRGMVFPHFQVASNTLTTPKLLVCPDDERRNWATNFTSDLTDKNLSYFLNVDSANGDPRSLLCGDRNITNKAPVGSQLVYLTKGATLAWNKELHSKKGYLLFGDGHVDLFNNRAAGAAIRIAAGVTNRLAVP